MKLANAMCRRLGVAALMAVVLPLTFAHTQAQAETFVDKAAESAIRASFKSARPDLSIESVSNSEVQGLYRAEVQNGPTFYASPDGKYILLGELYEIGENGIENVEEKRLMPERKAALSAVSDDDMITFSPKGETKASLYVFTDVDCGYCQKLHQEVPRLNQLGIAVHYLAYPRAGVGPQSPTYSKMVSAWCADDRQAAMDILKQGGNVPTKTCANPVAEQYRLGAQLGVTGTPAIVTESGRLIPGYKPADQLAATVLR